MTASKCYHSSWRGGYVNGSTEGEPTMKDRWKVPLVVLSVAGLTATMLVVLLVYILPAAAQDSCLGVQVNPGDDLDAIVNGDPATRATTFCIHAGTYLIDQVVVPRDGDALVGEPGTSTVIGPATKPEPVVLVRNGAALSRLVQPTGSKIHLEWLDISGANVRYNDQTQDTCGNWGEVANKCPQAGTGVAIASGKADGTLLITHVRLWGNEGLGIGSAKGRVLHSEFFDNTRNPDWVGFEGAAVKGVTEFEAAYNFVHDEQGNGLWCDHACTDDAARVNGAWFHHNLVVNNANWGLRYEFSPIVASGVHSSQPTFLAENNQIHGNGAGGTSMVDAQNGTFRANIFGPTTIAGVSYAANYKNRAIFFRDSGRAERTDLWKGDATGNELNGETIVGCEMPDDIVDCHDTTSPTVSSVAPTDGAATVALDANVEANFSEPIDASTISDTTFTLTLGGTPVSASVSYDSTTSKAMLNPNTVLQAGKTYTAKVKGESAGVKDLVGNPLAADKVWSFTTLPPPPTDTTAPRVTSTSPVANATGVAPSANVIATFSEKMMASSINTQTFKLLKVTSSGTTQITNVSVSLSTDGLTATLNPFGTSTTTHLARGTKYKAVITTGARDVAGNQLDQNSTLSGLQQKAWTFTVSP
jgi:hypothetical protein